MKFPAGTLVRCFPLAIWIVSYIYKPKINFDAIKIGSIQYMHTPGQSIHMYINLHHRKYE